MSLKIAISSVDGGEAAVASELCETLNREDGVSAAVDSGEFVEGARGVLDETVKVALNFVSGGAAQSIVNALGAYFNRSKTLEFTLERSNGDKLTLKSENISAQEQGDTLARLKAFLDEGDGGPSTNPADE